MLRVLQVIGKMDRAGAETILMNIYRNVDRSKVQFDFMVFSDEKGDYDDEIEELGGHIYHMPAFKGYNYFMLCGKFEKFFKRHPYKIVHGHIGSLAPAYLKAAKKRGAYVIAHSHATKSNRALENFVFNVFAYRVRYIADYFFACSNQAGIDRFGEKVVNSNRFEVINNAIDSEKYKYTLERHIELKKKYGFEDKLIIGHVGRFAPEKNHKFIVDVFEEICKKERKSILMLAGRGIEEEAVQKYVLGKNLEKKVIFLGVRNDIPDLMNLFDVFLFPSFYEGLGIVGIEAQAAGLPCFFSEHIPDEAVVTKHAWKQRLEDGAVNWADEIIKTISCFQRENSKDNIVKAGYDIENIANELQCFYLNKVGENKIYERY